MTAISEERLLPKVLSYLKQTLNVNTSDYFANFKVTINAFRPSYELNVRVGPSASARIS